MLAVHTQGMVAFCFVWNCAAPCAILFSPDQESSTAQMQHVKGEIPTMDRGSALSVVTISSIFLYFAFLRGCTIYTCGEWKQWTRHTHLTCICAAVCVCLLDTHGSRFWLKRSLDLHFYLTMETCSQITTHQQSANVDQTNLWFRHAHMHAVQCVYIYI